MIYRLRDWHDLRPFGIEILTGEACRVGLRALCDLNDSGLDIVSDLIGVGRKEFASPWNGGGAVASAMLPYSLWHDLAVWCLLHRGCVEVMDTKAAEPARETSRYWRLEDLRALASLDPAVVDCDHWLRMVAQEGECFMLGGGSSVDGISSDLDTEGWSYWQRHKDYLRHSGRLGRMYRVMTEQPGHGTRCTHQFSGRTA